MASTLIACVVLGAALFTTRAAEHPLLAKIRQVFVPGHMTSGHHQIEIACESCHTSPFGGHEILQNACVRCHGAALAQADDKHPLTKFTDPRNAELLAHLDARQCVTCHVEHRPEITLAMGMTQPKDVCVNCHQDIATERPSHRDMKFDTCTSSGCHNFHDNRALYEDFLLKHASEPKNKARPQLALTNFREVAEQLPSYPHKQFPISDLQTADVKLASSHNDIATVQKISGDWLASAHARAGVNCNACHQQQPHQQTGAETLSWVQHPDNQSCNACHALQNAGFLAGKHGMRLKEGLPAMTPAQGKLAFKNESAHKELNCTSCHGAHRFDVQYAATQACLTCHNDKHSVAYEQSPHAKTWQRELAHDAKPGTGVSCASCHLPRLAHEYEEYEVRQIYAEHNQNDTLRPNDKMIRPVCLNCHGLGFSMDALADRSLIDINFNGAPTRHVNSIDMAIEHVRLQKEKKQLAAAIKEQ